MEERKENKNMTTRDWLVLVFCLVAVSAFFTISITKSIVTDNVKNSEREKYLEHVRTCLLMENSKLAAEADGTYVQVIEKDGTHSFKQTAPGVIASLLQRQTNNFYDRVINFNE